MAAQSEAELEEELLQQLVNNGYERIKIRNVEGLIANFKIQLEKLNNCYLKDDEFQSILLYLDQGSIFDRAKKLRDKFFVEREGNPFYIEFLNQRDWSKNIFQVSNQITVHGKYENRYDVTILINGLPLVQIELKKRGMPIKEAFDQISRYTYHSYSGLFDFIQIFVISNGVNTKYFAWGRKGDTKFEFTFFWKDEENHNIKQLTEFADSFLERSNLVEMISKYMALNESSKTLMVLRAYQKYAVDAVIHQALEVKENGYVWHATGSGKTLTAYKVSQLLAEDESTYKVIFVVDRKDLDIQTYKEFNSFCDGCVDGTDHTGALIKNLTTEGKGKLVITTIQKLSKALRTRGDQNKLQKIKDKNIILIFDECHRGHFGKMHSYIANFFSHSLFFGFTGTPIFAENSGGDGKTTQTIFKKQLHTYMIKDAIADKNVLAFAVDYYMATENKETKEFLQSDERLSQIVDKLIESYDAKTKKRNFNAMFAVSRGGVIHKYYELFKNKRHDLKVATIFTYKPNEDIREKTHSRDLLESYIEDYNEMFGTNFSTDDFAGYHADVSKRMKNREIDLLLVVDMFLTGFDSPSLNTLYVDKDLKHHNLLQAFSRTNRVKNNLKSHGNIVCFRDIKNNVEESIKLFSIGGSDDVILPPYEDFVDQFNDELEKFYGHVKTVDEAQKLQSEKGIETFILNFRELLRIKNKLDTFFKFTFDDLKMTEQEFNDFTSVYKDFYNERESGRGGKGPTIGCIDFDIELLMNETINVDYILNLIADLEKTGPDRDRIIKILNENYPSREIKELIIKFIDEELENIDFDKTNVFEAFDNFMDAEREAAFSKIIEEEELKEDIAHRIIKDYGSFDKFDDDLIKESLKNELKFKERKIKVQNIKDKIEEVFEKFSY